MTKKILIIIFSALILTSCEMKKDYKYVEIVDEKGLFGNIERKEKEAKIIEAASDSSAYLDAYKEFCITLKVEHDVRDSIGDGYSITKGFKLYDDKNNEISDISFPNKDRREKEIQKYIFSLGNSRKEPVDKNK